MTFVVEDGTGLTTANSYGAVADADAYFTDRGITSWAGTSPQKQGWLVQATDYIELRWGDRFIGVEEFPDNPQALGWPRVDEETGDSLGVPLNLKKATYEYANRARIGPLAPDPSFDSGGAVTKSRKKVGPIETEVTYSAGTTSSGQLKPYPAADLLMKGLYVPSGGNRTYR